MKLLKALLISTVFFVSHSAFADVYNLGEIAPNESVAFESKELDTSVNIHDYFSFSLVADVDNLFGGALDVRQKIFSGKNIINITNVRLFSGDIGFSDKIKSDFDKSPESYSFKNLTAGTYYFIVDGKSRDNILGGQYALTIASVSKVVSSVPESETYAMLLGGLGVMGFILGRGKFA